MEIRVYGSEDQAAVIQLWHDCGLTRPWNDPARDIARKLAVQPELFLVGTEGARLIGSAMAGFDGHRGWIYYLAVAPDRRRQGHARRLVEAACASLSRIGCPKVELMVRDQNVDALAFYEAIGFETQPVRVYARRLIDDEEPQRS